MLQGHFSDWESGLAYGPDLDRVRVRLAIDATSTPADGAVGPNLFAFHSRKVESSAPADTVWWGPFPARAARRRWR